MKRFLSKRWYIILLALLAVVLVAASPTPRRMLSENFYDWIRIHGDQPYIYMDRENTSGAFYGLTVWRNYADQIQFYIGGYGVDADWLYWLVNAPGGNAITVDSQGDVGIKKTPAVGVELDVGGDIVADGEVNAERLMSKHDAEIVGDLEVGGDLWVDDSVGIGTEPVAWYAMNVAGPISVSHSIYAYAVELEDRVFAERISSRTYVVAAGDMTAYGYHWIGEELYVNDIRPHDDFPPHQYITFNDTSKIAQNNGNFASAGDAQSERYVVRRSATFSDATWYVLFGTGDLGAAQMHMPDDSAWTFEANVTIMTSGGDETAGYTIVGHIVNVDGDSTLQYSSVTTLYEDDASWDAAAAEWNPDGLKIQVQDADGGGDAIRAVAVVDIAQVAYP